MAPRPPRRWNSTRAQATSVPQSVGSSRTRVGKLSAAGSQGGFSGVATDVDDVLRMRKADVRGRTRSTEARELGCDDFRAIGHELRLSPPRKSAPPWEPPSELFRIMFWPAAISQDRRKTGIGYADDFGAPLFSRYMAELFTHIRDAQCMPVLFNYGQSYFLPKPDGTQRVIGVFGQIGRSLLRRCYSRGRWDSPPECMYGYRKARSVLQPILVQTVLAARLHDARLTNMRFLYDMRNAFFCGDPSDILAGYENGARPVDLPLLRDRLQSAVLRVQPLVGGAHQDLAVCSGSPPADSLAAYNFMDVFNPLVVNWLEATSGEAMWAALPWTANSWVDVGFTGYADDLARTPSSSAPLRRPSVRCACLASRWTTTWLTRPPRRSCRTGPSWSPSPTYMAEDAIVIFVVSTRMGRWRRTAPPSLAILALRLIMLIVFFPELRVLVASAYKSYMAFTRFWQVAPLGALRLFFRAIVVGVLLWGLEVRPLPASELQYLDRQLLHLAKKALGGKSTTRTRLPDGSDKVRSWSNDKFRRHFRLSRVATELRMRRLRMLRTMSQDYDSYGQTYAVLFGRLEQVPEDVVGADGRLLPGAPRLAHIIMADFEALRKHDEMAALGDFVDGKPHMLWDPGFVEVAARVDFDLLRQAELDVRVPPPGYVPASQHEDDVPLSAPEPVFVCRLLQGDGTPCVAAYATYQALRMHQVRRRVGEHERVRREHLVDLIDSSVCPACRVCLASVHAVRLHIGKSLGRG